MKQQPDAIVTADAARRIRVIRGVAVLFASDLAALYGVPASEISTFVERHSEIFPDDFVFRRSDGEFVFNEQGASMLAAQLCDSHGVATSISIMRAFILLRRSHPPARTAATFTNKLRRITRRPRGHRPV